MVDASKIRFPITLEEFTNLQRPEMHRSPTREDLEIFSEVVETANEVYYAAAEGDSEAVEAILSSINIVAAEMPEANHLAALCRGWSLKALLEGAKVVKKKLDSMEG